MTIFPRHATVPLTLALGAALGLAAAAPAQAATGAQRYIVHAGGCSGAVLNTRSGTFVLTAAHCGAVRTVTTAGGRRFTVVQRRTYGGPEATGDLMLLRVNGRVKSAVGGGFAIGTQPGNGSRINVYGFPSSSSRLAGCSGLRVSYVQGRYPQVNHCWLPNGTSGGPWYTSGVVLRGVVSGLNGGGATNYITNTVPFTHSVVSWIFAHSW